MGSYKEIEGDLIQFTKEGRFDVILHGCNCFCTMGAGLAPKMAKAFGCDKYPKEFPQFKGDKGKLGTIEGMVYNLKNLQPISQVYIFNAYTQYHWGPHASLEAIRSCLKILNDSLKSINKFNFLNPYIYRIGLPQIGCGLGGLNWEDVKQIIQEELKDYDVEIVIFK